MLVVKLLKVMMLSGVVNEYPDTTTVDNGSVMDPAHAVLLPIARTQKPTAVFKAAWTRRLIVIACSSPLVVRVARSLPRRVRSEGFSAVWSERHAFLKRAREGPVGMQPAPDHCIPLKPLDL
jgi:hypothetical protein